MPRSVCQCCWNSECCWTQRCKRAECIDPFMLKPPRPDEFDFDSENPGAALTSALQRPGGQAEALRHLRGLMERSIDPLKHIDAEQLSKMLRAGKRFDEFERLARPDFGCEGWSSGLVEDSRLWLAYRVDSNAQSLHTVLVQDVDGVDPVRAAVGYCTASLFQKHSSDVQSCTELAQSEDALLWHQIRKSSNDIVQVDLVNALHEPLGAIMLMIYPQPAGSPDFPGIAIPKASRSARSQTNRQCITLTPLPGGSMRMHVAALLSLGDQKTTTQVQQESMEGVVRLLRPLVSLWPKRFEAFLKEQHTELIHQESFSEQAPFYAVCRGYLTGQAGIKHSSLRQWTYMFGKHSRK